MVLFLRLLRCNFFLKLLPIFDNIFNEITAYGYCFFIAVDLISDGNFLMVSVVLNFKMNPFRFLKSGADRTDKFISFFRPLSFLQNFRDKSFGYSLMSRQIPFKLIAKFFVFAVFRGNPIEIIADLGITIDDLGYITGVAQITGRCIIAKLNGAFVAFVY